MPHQILSTGLIIAAPASGSGKTVVTLGILRALRDLGVPVAAAKSGPDYIDPRFHAAACGNISLNLDAWAMHPTAIRALASQNPGKLLIIEGAMGLFDGAPPNGKGATADLAEILDLPVVLIVDASHQAQSVAALVEGFARHRKSVEIVGIILNRIGSSRHEAMLRKALASFVIIGAIPRNEILVIPSRHLGLVQAGELAQLEHFIAQTGATINQHLDLTLLQSLARNLPQTTKSPAFLPPLGQRIAIAQDQAFSFTYPHVLNAWHSAGASIHPFSPLANQAPDDTADAIFLPGGYPELHAGKIASADTFINGLKNAADSKIIYGECGGFMVLGDGLIDAQGQRHQMLGLLRLETGFAQRRLHLGYRHLTALRGPWSGAFNGHEFHYCTILKAQGAPIFQAQNAEGDDLGAIGLVKGNVSGSFAHLIAKAPQP